MVVVGVVGMNSLVVLIVVEECFSLFLVRLSVVDPVEVVVVVGKFVVEVVDRSP